MAASQVAGLEASTIDRFLIRHGWDRNTAGAWEWVEPTSPADVLPVGGWLVVDEAGMVSQDSARALVRTAIAHGWQVRVQGDSFQFGAVGVGGVMDLAKQAADPGRVWLLDDANDVHRFRLRTGEKDEAYGAQCACGRADPEQTARTVMVCPGVRLMPNSPVVAVFGLASMPFAGAVIAGTNDQRSC